MSKTEEDMLYFIIESKQEGLTLLASISGYSLLLQKDIFGEMSGSHRKALQVIVDCCETLRERWMTLLELIDQNEHEKAREILSQVEDTGQSCLTENFITKSIASLEIADQQSSAILGEVQQLSDEQRKYMEIINKNCKRSIDIWKEMGLHFCKFYLGG